MNNLLGTVADLITIGLGAKAILKRLPQRSPGGVSTVTADAPPAGALAQARQRLDTAESTTRAFLNRGQGGDMAAACEQMLRHISARRDVLDGLAEIDWRWSWSPQA